MCCRGDLGLCVADVANLATAWQRNIMAIEQATRAAGGFLVQMFTDGNHVEHHGSSRSCDQFFSGACSKGSMQHAGPLLWGAQGNVSRPGAAPDFLEQLAGFLLVRGPYAYFSPADDGWVGSSYPYPPRSVYGGYLDRDFGTPVGQCKSEAAGVWVREWTKATVQLNCSAWQAQITMK